MVEVTVYTTAICPYCVRAKALLERKGIDYREIDVTGNGAVREKLVRETGRRTVPQIFIGERAIGGFEELRGLAESGELDELLKGG